MSIACRESDTWQRTESATSLAERPEPEHPESVPIEPDYQKLISDLGIESVIEAVWQDEEGFVLTESAGASSDAIASFREALDILDPIQFQNDPSSEGILDIALSEGGNIWSTIIDGRCMIDLEREDLLVSPRLLIRAVRQRETSASDGPTGAK